MGADRAILVQADAAGRAARRGTHLPQAHREGISADRAARQAGHRRRQQPDRPDARGAVESAAGDVCFEGRARRRARRSVTREVDAGLETIEVDLPAVIHQRPASQRAALREAAGHHEGEEEAARHDRRSPISASTRRAQFKTLKYEPPAARQKGVMVKDVGRTGRGAQAEGVWCDGQDSHRCRACERQAQSRHRQVRGVRQPDPGRARSTSRCSPPTRVPSRPRRPRSRA